METKPIYNKIAVVVIGIIPLIFTSLIDDAVATSSVYTPKGSEVSVASYNEVLPADLIEAYRKQYRKDYPSAEFIGEPTIEYNCHHYAWHMVPGNSDKWWMDSYTEKGENNIKYITDGSYVQVDKTSSEATHLVYFLYGLPNHSAVKSTEQGKVVSKWGKLWLVRHKVGDCPYDSQDIRYYKLNMWINGPTIIDGDSSTPIKYTLQNAPQGATITWTVLPNECLIDGQGTATITVRPRTQLRVSVQTSVGGSKVNVPEMTTSFSQALQINDIDLFRYGQEEYDFTLKAICNVSIDTELECVWECSDPDVEFYDIPYPDDAMFIDGIGRFTAVRFPRDGTYTISAYALAVNDPYLGSSRVFSKEFTISRIQRIDPPVESE